MYGKEKKKRRRKEKKGESTDLTHPTISIDYLRGERKRREGRFKT